MRGLKVGKSLLNRRAPLSLLVKWCRHLLESRWDLFDPSVFFEVPCYIIIILNMIRKHELFNKI